jgi:ectoine hydroxylase-related dioxygenase (phytanoyl-CoA dioxygenase family)
MLSTLMSGKFSWLLGRSPAPAAPAVSDAQRAFFEENGYLILKGMFDAAAVAALRERLDTLWRDRAGLGDVAIDAYFNLPNTGRMFFRKVGDEVRAAPYKILDLHLVDDMIRDACAHPGIVAAVKGLLGATPLVCNSLFFEWGSQQEAHFDTFFMPSNTPNMMAASWIALDQVTETNGPLYYYPKSHLIPPYMFSHGKINAIFSELKTGAAEHIERIIAEHGLKKAFFMPEPGDVLIWHAQLLHGGSAIENPRERRRSLVTHYWTEVDFPDEGQRIDLGDGRWLLNKPHQYVVDDDVLAEVDAFLATVNASDDERAAVPPSFDARLYLARNQDVLRAGESPWRHYVNHGLREGRIW